MLIFVAFIPISLVVTLEIIKFFQAMFISWDASIYDESKDMPTKVQSSNLNEELGQIEYIFSDKTGTLTQNIMEFKKLCVGQYSYGLSDESQLESFSRETNLSSESLSEENINDHDIEKKLLTKKISSIRKDSDLNNKDPDITNV